MSTYHALQDLAAIQLGFKRLLLGDELSAKAQQTGQVHAPKLAPCIQSAKSKGHQDQQKRINSGAPQHTCDKTALLAWSWLGSDCGLWAITMALTTWAKSRPAMAVGSAGERATEGSIHQDVDGIGGGRVIRGHVATLAELPHTTHCGCLTICAMLIGSEAPLAHKLTEGCDGSQCEAMPYDS